MWDFMFMDRETGEEFFVECQSLREAFQIAWDNFGMDNVEIIHGDILETDIKGVSEAAMKEYGLKELRIIGNLPYYITTPIITKKKIFSFEAAGA